MKITHQEIVSNLIWEIWYQHPSFWPTTFSNCSNDGCQESARGGRECKDCLKKQLSLLTSDEFSTEFFDLLESVRKYEHELMESKPKRKKQ